MNTKVMMISSVNISLIKQVIMLMPHWYYDNTINFSILFNTWI